MPELITLEQHLPDVSLLTLRVTRRIVGLLYLFLAMTLPIPLLLISSVRRHLTIYAVQVLLTATGATFVLPNPRYILPNLLYAPGLLATFVRLNRLPPQKKVNMPGRHGTAPNALLLVLWYVVTRFVPVAVLQLPLPVRLLRLRRHPLHTLPIWLTLLLKTLTRALLLSVGRSVLWPLACFPNRRLIPIFARLAQVLIVLRTIRFRGLAVLYTD